MAEPSSMERIREARRVITDAVADIPLACSGPEAAAAVQGLGLSMAEACMEPVAIARLLMAQAEAYLSGAPASISDGQGDLASRAAAVGHPVLSAAAAALMQAGLEPAQVARMMIIFAAGWLGKSEGSAAAEVLYRQADALATREGRVH